MGPQEVTATDRYRGYKLTLTQQPNGACVWSIWTKAAGGRWCEWVLEESGCRHLTVPLRSRDEVVELLASVLSDLRQSA